MYWKFVRLLPWLAIPALHVMAVAVGWWIGYTPQSWYYLAPEQVLKHWPDSLWFWHAAPPGLQAFQLLFELLKPIPPRYAAAGILGLMHAFSFTTMHRACKNMGLSHAFLWPLFFWVLNPAVLFQAGQWHGSTFAMHVLAVAAAAHWVWPKHFWSILWFALGFTAWFRPIFNPIFLAFGVLPFLPYWWPKRRWYWVFPLLALSFLPVKNGLVFGQWTASSWQWRNLAAHIPPGKPEPINFEHRFDSLRFFRENPGLVWEDSLKQRFADCSVCFLGGHNDLRFFEINQAYRLALKEQATWSHSTATFAYGVATFLSHPIADNEYQVERLTGPAWLKTYMHWGNLPNLNYQGSEIRLSFMTLIWPLFFFWALFRWRKMAKVEQQLLGLMGFIGLAYSGIDPNEANRMRMELMGVFWVLAFCGMVSNTLHKNSNKHLRG